LLLTAAAVAASAGEQPSPPRRAGFASKPSAKKTGGKTVISFAVKSPCAVQVEVLGAGGKVVRHLGGGMLGENSPLPFKKGLSQAIEWDGKDDFGKPAAGGPFKVRVGLGLEPEFDRLIGWSGQEVEDIRGICCGPAGTLYVVYGGQLYAHRRTSIISAFDRDGKYLRQVLPGPAGLPAAKRKGWPHVAVNGNGEIPVVQHVLARAVVPGLILGDRVFPAAASDRLVVLSGNGAGFARVSDPDFREGRRLLVIGTDGSVPANYLGPKVADDMEKGHGWAALSPDGKTAYACGVGTGGQVWRADVKGSAPAKPFITSGLTDPKGMDTDRDGNLYVADFGADRVAVFDAAGKEIESISAKKPWNVRVSSKSGATYVLAEAGAKLLKLGGLSDPTVKASIPTKVKPSKKGGTNVFIALDDSAEPHAVWLVNRFWHNGKLNKLVDKGSSFEDLGDVIAKKRKKNSAINFTGNVAVAGGKLISRVTDFGYNRNTSPLAFDAVTGEPAGTFGPRRTGEVTAGKDGRFYVTGNGFKKPFPVTRLGLDGKKLPFSGGAAIAEVWHGHTRTWGLFADRHGNVYIPGGDKYRALNPATVRVFGPDGKRKNAAAVKTKSASLGGIAVDSRGNIYIGAQVAPKGQAVPEWFAGKLPKDTAHGYPSLCYMQYGSVVKFPPTGGEIAEDAAGKYQGYYTKHKSSTVSLKGALWARRGGHNPIKGKGAHCFCETSRFDIDFHDRLFVPDYGRFAVQVLDSSGNQVALIGSYGNMDNRGPKSAHPKPEIAYGWPLATCVSGGRLYVSDLVNRRIVVAKLLNAVSETCSVR
jgi:sugar lactone lactonase YvrE